MVKAHLTQLLEQGVINALDYAFGQFVARQAADHPRSAAILAALLSNQLAQQHSCVRLDELDPQWLVHCGVNSLTELLSQVRSAGILADVNDGSISPSVPLVVDGDGLYLQRYWHYEKRLAGQVLRMAERTFELPVEATQALLTQLFTVNAADANPLDWQKVAVCMAASRQFAMITGGPGTGKTTTVTRLLALVQGLAEQQGKPLRIKLIAPTGKAAARLSESMSQARSRLPDALQRHLPTECSTIHRLLGARPQRTGFVYDASNRLHLDLIVVDEASMVDLPLMTKLFDALPEHARAVLLGDKDQLASVETGSVLSDLCEAALYKKQHAGFSATQTAILKQLCDFPLPQDASYSPLSDALVVLQKSHRFAADSGIGALAGCFNNGDYAASVACFGQYPLDIGWHKSASPDTLIDALSDGFKAYFDAVRDGDTGRAFSLLQQQQVLCATRKGEWGVEQLNQRIARQWQRNGWVSLDHEFYPGRPVMLNSNDHTLRLYNGDIGIVMPDPQQPGLRKVWFANADGQYRGVLPSQLPPHDTVYAMTIHKSQGSEFAQVHLCLPGIREASGMRGLNRALLYTGLTRAKQAFQLYSHVGVLKQTLANVVTRQSGLAQRLRS